MGESAQRRLAAIMFTDMVGYSALSQKDEELAVTLLDEHRELLRPLFPKYGGKDQKTLALRNAIGPQERGIQVRVGIHLGDVIYQDGDVYGDGVNIACFPQKTIHSMT